MLRDAKARMSEAADDQVWPLLEAAELPPSEAMQVGDGVGQGIQRWLAEFGQGDKWRVCLKAAMMPRIRSEHDEADPPDPQSGRQGEGGIGRPQGREDAGRFGAAIRCACELDHGLEGATGWRRGGGVGCLWGCDGSGGGREDIARQDWGADAGERFSLLLESGVLASLSHQGCDKGAKEGFAAAPSVVHELEEAEIERQLLLRDTPVRSQPGAQ